VEMELQRRRVHLAGITIYLHDKRMKQIARNLTAANDGSLIAKRYLLMDLSIEHRSFAPSRVIGW
jgi:hypothetical protein